MSTNIWFRLRKPREEVRRRAARPIFEQVSLPADQKMHRLLDRLRIRAVAGVAKQLQEETA